MTEFAQIANDIAEKVKSDVARSLHNGVDLVGSAAVGKDQILDGAICVGVRSAHAVLACITAPLAHKKGLTIDEVPTPMFGAIFMALSVENDQNGTGRTVDDMASEASRMCGKLGVPVIRGRRS